LIDAQQIVVRRDDRKTKYKKNGEMENGERISPRVFQGPPPSSPHSRTFPRPRVAFSLGSLASRRSPFPDARAARIRWPSVIRKSLYSRSAAGSAPSDNAPSLRCKHTRPSSPPPLFRQMSLLARKFSPRQEPLSLSSYRTGRVQTQESRREPSFRLNVDSTRSITSITRRRSVTFRYVPLRVSAYRL
jgi:hypothetical protein